MNGFIEREKAENDLLACAAFVAERIGGTDAYAQRISEIAARYAARGELDLAAGLADSIRDPHARDVCLSEIAVQCVAFNDDDYGLQLIEAIEDYGYQQQALHLIVAQQASLGKISAAHETAAELDDPLTANAEIAVRNARNNDEAGARDLLAQIDLPIIRVQVLNEIASAKINRNNAADEVLTETLAEIENVELIEEQAQLLLEIATKFFAADSVERGFEILEKTKQLADRLERRFRDLVLTQIALLYAHANEFERAENILKTIEDLQQTAAGHLAIAQEYQIKNRDEQVIGSLEEAYAVLKSQPDRQVRDSKARFGLFAAIAARFAEAKMFERALEIASENPDEDLRNNALSSIAVISDAAGKSDLARQTIDLINDYSIRAGALNLIGRARNQNQDAENGVRALNEASALGEEIGQLILRSKVLNEIAESFAVGGSESRAAEILNDSLRITQMIVDQNLQSSALLNLADTFQKLNFELSGGEREILHLIVRKRS